MYSTLLRRIHSSGLIHYEAIHYKDVFLDRDVEAKYQFNASNARGTVSIHISHTNHAGPVLERFTLACARV